MIGRLEAVKFNCSELNGLLPLSKSVDETSLHSYETFCS